VGNVPDHNLIDLERDGAALDVEQVSRPVRTEHAVPESLGTAIHSAAATPAAVRPLQVPAVSPHRPEKPSPRAAAFVGAAMLSIVTLRLFWVSDVHSEVLRSAIKDPFEGQKSFFDGQQFYPQEQEQEEERQNGLSYSDLEMTVEAKEFLDTPNALVSDKKFSPSQLQQLVAELYAAGCARVMFAGVRYMDEDLVSSWLVVSLPHGDSEKRAQILGILGRVDGDEADRTDTGQQFEGITLE
jgi:hypothetical protein